MQGARDFTIEFWLKLPQYSDRRKDFRENIFQLGEGEKRSVAIGIRKYVTCYMAMGD